jgi:hypothetical protein
LGGTCDFIKSVFTAAKNNPHYNYRPVLMMLKEMEGAELMGIDLQEHIEFVIAALAKE